MTIRRARTILFDWDGTLLDSFPASYKASMTVFRHFGIEVDEARFMDTYSPNWLESYRELGVPESQWDRANQIWLDSYCEQRTDLFPNATADLERLRHQRFTVGLVTSGSRNRVTSELDRHQLTNRFAAIVCSEDTELKKPDPAPLNYALETIGADPEQTIFVGDRPEDITMGKAVGTFTVGVVSKYGPRSILRSSGPDLLFDNITEMVDHLIRKID